MIIVHMKNNTEKKKKVMFSPHKNVIFLGGSIGRGVLRVRNKFF